MWMELVGYWAKWGKHAAISYAAPVQYPSSSPPPPKWLGVGVCHQGVVMRYTKALGSLDHDSVAFKLVLLQLVAIPRVSCL